LYHGQVAFSHVHLGRPLGSRRDAVDAVLAALALALLNRLRALPLRPGRDAVDAVFSALALALLNRLSTLPLRPRRNAVDAILSALALALLNGRSFSGSGLVFSYCDKLDVSYQRASMANRR